MPLVAKMGAPPSPLVLGTVAVVAMMGLVHLDGLRRRWRAAPSDSACFRRYLRVRAPRRLDHLWEIWKYPWAKEECRNDSDFGYMSEVLYLFHTGVFPSSGVFNLAIRHMGGVAQGPIPALPSHHRGCSAEA